MPNNPPDQKIRPKKQTSKHRSRFGPNGLILYISGALLSLLLLVVIPPHPIRIPTALGGGFAIAMILYTILPR